MPWSRATQRVLFVLAATLLASALVSAVTARRPTATSVTDDPALEVRLDLNRATAAEIETLPGVGVALAERVVAFRSTHGPFRSVDDLRQIPGFGEKVVAGLRPLLLVR